MVDEVCNQQQLRACVQGSRVIYRISKFPEFVKFCNFSKFQKFAYFENWRWCKLHCVRVALRETATMGHDNSRIYGTHITYTITPFRQRLFMDLPQKFFKQYVIFKIFFNHFKRERTLCCADLTIIIIKTNTNSQLHKIFFQTKINLNICLQPVKWH